MPQVSQQEISASAFGVCRIGEGLNEVCSGCGSVRVLRRSPWSRRLLARRYGLVDFLSFLNLQVQGDFRHRRLITPVNFQNPDSFIRSGETLVYGSSTKTTCRDLLSRSRVGHGREKPTV